MTSNHTLIQLKTFHPFIKTSEEYLVDVPKSSCSDWGVITDFALSFNGYHYLQEKYQPKSTDEFWDMEAEFWDQTMGKEPLSDNSIDDLRACLFLLQRAARFCDSYAGNLDQAQEIIHTIIDKVVISMYGGIPKDWPSNLDL